MWAGQHLIFFQKNPLFLLPFFTFTKQKNLLGNLSEYSVMGISGISDIPDSYRRKLERKPTKTTDYILGKTLYIFK